MLIKSRRSWELPESEATPEAIYLNRRALIGGAAGALALTACGAESGGAATASTKDATAGPGGDPTADLYPARQNGAFTLDRALTREEVASTHNNFYEFGAHKGIHKAAQKLPLRPWAVVIDGDVAKPQTLDIDTLIRKMALEERLYRLRCVEAWAMAVPWTGFPLRALLDLAEPLSRARYVGFETFLDPKVAPGQREVWYPWPYREALTIDEAAHDLTFLVTGVYGKPMKAQFGAPLRLALPWKYGFKSIKSLVRITLLRERPPTFWESVGPSEYGFWANVNPDVPHPRWSQATERMLGTDERRKTLLFNGYGAEVAGLYRGLEGEPLYR